MKEVLSLKQAVLATIAYADLLNFPLKCEEIEEYLYGWSATREAIEAVLKEIQGVIHLNGYYCLNNRIELIETRKKNDVLIKNYWKKIRRFRFLFQFCPFVRSVAVCNSVSYGNVKETSDIDLFVITADRKLSIARFFLKLMTQLFGVRVHHDFISKRFCLSFFVTESAHNLKAIAYEFDPHLAYFVKTMTPLFGAKAFDEFLRDNESWMTPYFKRPNKSRSHELMESGVARKIQFVSECFLRIFGDSLENLIFKFQMKRDLNHKKQILNSSGFIMNKYMFKAHEEDPRANIASQFLNRINAICS